MHIKDYKLMNTIMLTIANVLGCNPMKFKGELDRHDLLENICLFLKQNGNIFVHEKARKNITFLLSNYCLAVGEKQYQNVSLKIVFNLNRWAKFSIS
jgi:hypothetical protein